MKKTEVSESNVKLHAIKTQNKSVDVVSEFREDKKKSGKSNEVRRCKELDRWVQTAHMKRSWVE
eukprot:602880-Hanusia_phi.AAC.1